MPAMQTTIFAAIVSNWFQSAMLVNSRLNTPDRISDKRQKPARTLSQPIIRVIYDYLLLTYSLGASPL